MKRLLPTTILFATVLSACTIQNTTVYTAPTPSTQPIAQASGKPATTPYKNLQLDTFDLPTPAPTGDCPRDMGLPKPSGCRCPEDHTSVCENYKCIGAYPTTGDPNQIAPWEYCPGSWDRFCTQPGRYDTCIGKPVIYLYPQHEEQVTVSLQVPGSITASDPLYPQNGWQNLDAFPDGSFFFNGSTYHELFYESAVPTVAQPTSGVVIDSNHVVPMLTLLTTQLGLTTQEQQEFLLYWLPKLDALHAPYFFFSVFDAKTKEAVDHVTILPKPDTTIAFLAYFKPLQRPISVPPLKLPPTPQRIGFTSVEWGGTIASE